jgi:hypothetical protein
MKKLILITLFALLATNLAFAQDENFSLGIKAGLNGSFIGKIPDQVERDGVFPGFVGGIYARFNTRGGTNLYFQPEVVFSQTGARGKFSSTVGFVTTSGDFRTTLNNVDVPFLVGLRLGIKGVGVRVNGGPVMSYAFSAKRKITGTVENDGSINIDVNETITDAINQFQAGIQAGVGVDLGRINLDLRYQYNFTKLYKDGTFSNDGYSIPQGDSQIRVIQLTAGIKLF